MTSNQNVESAPPAPVIVARGLTKRFGAVTAVDGIYLEVMAGECLGLLGPNGAGKTSTMRMLYDFSPRDGGSLTVFGLDPAIQGARVRQVIGVVPQTDNLDMDLTVRENLNVYGGYYGIRGRALRERLDELLEFTGLSGRQKSNIRELSGGQRRRLTIIRALVNRPRLVILDEPSTGLDPQARHEIWGLLRELIATGVTIVLSTHYMDEAARLCDRLVIMDRGRVIQEGRPDDLVRRFLPPLVLEVERRCLAEGWEESPLEREMYGDRVFFMADEESAYATLDLTRAERRLVRRANLEDLYLKLTGRGLDD
jgi:lipooligosaccharide transport system ATP-binding protein